MDLKFTLSGPRGKTCADCSHFQAPKPGLLNGMCFNHEVPATAGCNFFRKK